MKNIDGRSKAARALKMKNKALSFDYINKRKAEVAKQAVPASLQPLADKYAAMRQVGGDHYVSMTVQPWAAMEAWMTPEQYVGFLRGNAIKYLARCDVKGGLDDIKKAHHYLTELIEFSERQE